ncbi:MAG: 16S rRNA (guanine(527)-N(7))-methyltransferase RsmG [candidate division NC10 bacterium]
MKTPGRSEPTPDDLLIVGAQELGIRLGTEQIGAFRLYLEEVLRWSERMNITALTTPDDIIREGFLDSLACLALIPNDARHILDVGSGAGFPALPLAIVRDDLDFTLVEASRKKVTFLKHIARSLGLRHVRVWYGRAEAMAGGLLAAEAYDVALARAVAPLPDQAALVLSFLRPGGVFLAQVGSGGAPEEALDRLAAAGYQAAGERRVPSWKGGGLGHQVLAYRRRRRPGTEECFT